MSISPISTANVASAASAYSSNQSSAAQPQTQTSPSTIQTGSGQTTVTLSAAAQGVPAAADTSALSDAMYKATAASQNSVVIYTIGVQHMNVAMQALNTDWNATKQTIAAQRPDLLNQKWDIVTNQGTLQVVSNTLSSSDKAWLTGVINQNKNLAVDTQNINTIAVSTFGGTAAMAADDTLGMTLTSLNQSSVDGKIQFLALLGQLNGQIKGTPVVGKIAPWGNLNDQGNALAAAFSTYLYPAFSSTSVQDGTNALVGENIDARGLRPSDVTTVTNLAMSLMGALSSYSDVSYPIIGGFTQSFETLAEQTDSRVLGANYRTYGEALTTTDTSNSTTGKAVRRTEWGVIRAA